MNSNAPSRVRPSQLELPLHQPDSGRDAPSVDGWRLDEETRQIGRQGVAAARALLDRPAHSVDGRRPDGDRGPTGRAA